MSLSNDELHRHLIEQLRDLTSRHVVGQSKQRNAKLYETLHLLDAHERGEDITLAKLAYVTDERPPNVIARINGHLRGDDPRWWVDAEAGDPIFYRLHDDAART